MKEYKLTKLKDIRFNGCHPNGFQVGYTKQGFAPFLPTVGLSFYLGALRTSTVTEVLNDKGEFKTQNTVYKLEEIED